MKRYGAGSIRPSQLISTFGPGSIYDNLEDSFLIMGLDSWKEDNCKELVDETLLTFLKRSKTSLSKFLVPISDDSEEDKIAIKTFPTWGVCPACKRLQHKDRITSCASESCKDKNIRINPVRFVAVCENGHLEDFPWFKWIHRKKECGETESMMYLKDTGRSSSLNSLIAECTTCGQKQSMVSAISKNGLKTCGLGYCNGKRPWLKTNDQKCVDKSNNPVFMQGLYKGATNFYFPRIMRAITIPPFSDKLTEKIIRTYKCFRYDLDKPHEIVVDKLVNEFPEDEDLVRKVAKRLLDAHSGKGEVDIRGNEFHALSNTNGNNDANFRTNSITVPKQFSRYIEHLTLVRKLREVVTLTGFYRLEPHNKSDPRPISKIGHKTQWLPAVENIGEGIFFSFDNGEIDKRFQGQEATERFKSMKQMKNSDLVGDISPSKKYVFLHSLSHALIREIADHAGYDMASLRERIYSDDKMAGILIYTSSSSSDGSLGGLVEQGNRFDLILQKAIRRSALCSSDPLCSSSDIVMGTKPNGAACHACLYLPETSCESMNNFLDRAFIEKTLTTEIGFFTHK